MFETLVFLDVAQDCSLGQCLTSSRAKTSRKVCGPNYGLTGSNRGRNKIFQHIFLTSVKEERSH